MDSFDGPCAFTARGDRGTRALSGCPRVADGISCLIRRFSFALSFGLLRGLVGRVALALFFLVGPPLLLCHLLISVGLSLPQSSFVYLHIVCLVASRDHVHHCGFCSNDWGTATPLPPEAVKPLPDDVPYLPRTRCP